MLIRILYIYFSFLLVHNCSNAQLNNNKSNFKDDRYSFGGFLNEGWNLKKKFASSVTSPEIEALYDTALANGAIGGKVTGAGGGGFMYLFCKFDKKHDVIKAVKDIGGVVYDFSFDLEGCQTWRTL